MIRFVMVGISHWHSEFHVSSFLKAGAHLAGVYDPDHSKASVFGKKYCCPAFNDFHEMIRTVEPDFIVAMARHIDMPRVALELLETGIPFSIEKPLGLNAQDVAAVVEEAYKRNAFVAVPFINRYSRIWDTLSTLRRQNRLGKPLHAHFRVINGAASRYPALGVPWMLDPTLSGGGCLRNLGIHGADAFLSFSGEKPEVLSADLQKIDRSSQIEDYAVALVRATSGVVGILESGYSYAIREAGGDFEWRVATTNCYIVDKGSELIVATLDNGKTETIPNITSDERYALFGSDTLRRLEAGEPPIAGPEDCYNAMELVDAIYAKGSVR